jgi:hypothetical protein
LLYGNSACQPVDFAGEEWWYKNGPVILGGVAILGRLVFRTV